MFTQLHIHSTLGMCVEFAPIARYVSSRLLSNFVVFCCCQPPRPPMHNQALSTFYVAHVNFKTSSSLHVHDCHAQKLDDGKAWE